MKDTKKQCRKKKKTKQAQIKTKLKKQIAAKKIIWKHRAAEEML